MVWASVWRALTGWRRPKRQITLELTPEEQVAVRFLTEFGHGTEDAIFQDVVTRRWTEYHMITTALFNLQVKGLARLADRGAGAMYFPTERAFQVLRSLPLEPTSSILLYLTVDAAPATRPERPPAP